MGKLGKPQKTRKHKKLKPIESSSPPKHKIHRGKHGKQEINSKPANVDNQEVPYSVREVMKLRQQTKEGNFKRSRNKYKGDHRPPSDPNDAVPGSAKARPMKPAPVFKQGNRESSKQFMNRVDRTVQAVIHKAQFEDKFNVDLDEKKDGKLEVKKRKKPKTEHQQLREKDRLAAKKAKKVKKVEKNYTGFEKLTDHIQFGEVAMAPPSITAKPRKVKDPKTNRPGTKSLLLKEALSGQEPQKPKPPPTYHKREVGKTVKRKNLPMVQQRILDAERQRAIDMYRKLKGHTKLPFS